MSAVLLPLSFCEKIVLAIRIGIVKDEPECAFPANVLNMEVAGYFINTFGN